MVVQANGEELEVFEDYQPNMEEATETTEMHDAVELSLNSVVGFTGPGTIKLKGKIDMEEVVVMIDSGATHNFITQRLVDDLKLPLTDTANYGILLGSGPPIKGKGVCKGVVLSLGDLTVVENFIPLDLVGVDVVLGMIWLHTLGETRVNWTTLTITIEKDEGNIVLKGDPSLTKTKVSLRRMVKTWDESD